MPQSLDMKSEAQISKEEDDFSYTVEWQKRDDTFVLTDSAFLETEKKRVPSEYQCFQGLSPTKDEDVLHLHGKSNAAKPQGEAVLYVYLPFPVADLQA